MSSTTKKLGIWMDHSSAHLINFNSDSSSTETIDSAFTHEVMEQALSKGEHLAHNKEQHQQSGYYKKLAETIKNYTHVILFGPTEAKNELANILKADHHFDKIVVETRKTDKMTDNQQHAYVKEYFSQKQ